MGGSVLQPLGPVHSPAIQKSGRSWCSQLKIAEKQIILSIIKSYILFFYFLKISGGKNLTASTVRLYPPGPNTNLQVS